MPQTDATSICCITNRTCKERGKMNYDELNRSIMHKYININNGTLIIGKFFSCKGLVIKLVITSLNNYRKTRWCYCSGHMCLRSFRQWTVIFVVQGWKQCVYFNQRWQRGQNVLCAKINHIRVLHMDTKTELHPDSQDPDLSNNGARYMRARIHKADPLSHQL